MLSGIGPADHLRALGVPVVGDVSGVGSNLQDHLKLSIRWNGRTTLPPSTVTAGMFVRSQPGRWRRRVNSGSAVLRRPRRRSAGSLRDDHGFAGARPRVAARFACGRADPLAAPMIRGNYLQEQADVRALLEGVRLARALGSSAAYDSLRADEIEPGPSTTSAPALVEFVRRAADTIYHPAGTCRMGTDTRCRRRRTAPGAGRGGTANRRCVDHAGCRQRDDKRRMRDDWLPRGGFRAGRRRGAAAIRRRLRRRRPV